VVIFVSRLIPFARAAFPYVAGVAEMSFARFFALATLGSVVWITALGVVGREVGKDWEAWRHHLEYADYAVVVLVVLAIVYLVIRRRTRGRGAPPDDGGTGPAQDADGRRPEPTMDVVSK
jgi:membrane-associated protein